MEELLICNINRVKWINENMEELPKYAIDMTNSGILHSSNIQTRRRKDLWISSPPNSSYLHFMAITTQSLPFIGLVSNCQSAMKYLYQSQVSSSNSGQTSTRQREMARIWIRFGEVKFQIQTLLWESMFSLDRRWCAVNVTKTIRKIEKVGKNCCKHHKQ